MERKLSLSAVTPLRASMKMHRSARKCTLYREGAIGGPPTTNLPYQNAQPCDTLRPT